MYSHLFIFIFVVCAFGVMSAASPLLMMQHIEGLVSPGDKGLSWMIDAHKLLDNYRKLLGL